jgi:hypothetical protein
MAIRNLSLSWISIYRSIGGRRLITLHSYYSCVYWRLCRANQITLVRTYHFRGNEEIYWHTWIHG